MLLNRDSKIAGGRFSLRARKEEVRTVPVRVRETRAAERNVEAVGAWLEPPASGRCTGGGCTAIAFSTRRNRITPRLHRRYIVIVRSPTHNTL